MAQPAGVATKFERLYASYQKPILAYCLRRAGRADAEDAASETFAIAWRRIDDVPQGDKTLPWLYGVAYKTLANQRRAVGRLRKLVERLGSLGTDQQRSPEAQVVRSTYVELVHQTMARLRVEDQELLRLVAWEELPRYQIAEILGVSRQTVNQRFHRAVKRMGRELAKSGFERTPPQLKERGNA